MKIALFITTFSPRSFLLKEFLYHYKRSSINMPLFIFTDGGLEFHLDDNTSTSEQTSFLQHYQDKFRQKQYSRPINELRRKYIRIRNRLRGLPLPYSKNPLGYSSNWGKRLYKAIETLQAEGYEYAIWTCDDGFIRKADISRLNNAIEVANRDDVDCYRLTEKSNEKLFKKISIDNQVIMVKSVSSPYTITHQTSLWKLSSLKKITRKSDCACQHEIEASLRFCKMNFKLYEFSGEPIIYSKGLYSDLGYIEDLNCD